jgi:serine phosphatase RsbU (regulator of sigma subunit)
LLGVFETEYRLKMYSLHPGDKVLLYTDGMDTAGFENLATGTPSLVAAAQKYSQLPIDELVDRLSDELFSQTKQSDDLTLFGLEVTA